MEKLLSPDIGLSVWTTLTFLLLVVLLGKLAWKPVLQALEERESAIRAEREAAEAARRSAEELKAHLDRELAQIQERTQLLLSQAERQGAAQREEILRAAQADANQLMGKIRSQLEEEKKRLVRELRQEVSQLSLMAAEKILKRSVDRAMQESLLREFFGDLDKRSEQIH